MRLANHDLVLLPALVPVVALGLFPLVLLPMLGFLGFAVLGVLLGFAAVMADLEEHGAHTAHVIAHGALNRSEHAGHSLEMRTLARSLAGVKLVSAALVVLGIGGFALS
jgi:hypothetical protein